MSNRTIAPKPSNFVGRGPHRIQINPYRSEVWGRNSNQSVLDLGPGLLRNIVGDEHEDSSLALENYLVRQLPEQSAPLPPRHLSSNLSLDTTSMTPRNLVQQLSNRAFDICYRLNEIIPPNEFDNMADSLYAVNPVHWGLEEYDSIALLSAVLALAHSVDFRVHQTLGCTKAIAESKDYFRTASDILDRNQRQVTSLTQLRTIMCMMLYQLITTSAVAALDFLNIACFATLNLGLYDEFSFNVQVDQNENTPRQNLLWSVLYFDMYLCSLLAKPPFIDTYSSEAATLAAIRHAARNVGTYVRSSQSFILTVGLALQIELFKLMRLGSKAKRDNDLAEIQRIKHELEDWEVLFINIFPQDEVVNVVARTRFELRMCHYLAIISLCSAPTRLVNQKTLIQEAETDLQAVLRRWRLQTALKAVDQAVTYCRLPGHSPFVEPSAYALFVAVLCLITASHWVEEDMEGAVLVSIERGLLLLTHVACLSLNESKIYMTVVQELVSKHELLDIDESLSNATRLIPDLVSHTCEYIEPFDAIKSECQ